MNIITRTLSVAMLIPLSVTPAARAADPPKPVAPAGSWPTWCGGPDRNAVSLEKGLVDGFEEWDGKGALAPRLRNVLWAAPLNPKGQTAGSDRSKANNGATVWGSPVVSGGRVFVTGSSAGAGGFDHEKTIGTLWCLDEKTGRILWRFQSYFIKKLYNRSWGMTATPTVVGDRVYVINHLGDVLCLDVQGMANGNQGPFLDEKSLLTRGREVLKTEIDAQGKTVLHLSEGVAEELPPDAGDVIWRCDLMREVNCRPYNCLTGGILALDDLLFVGTCSTSRPKDVRWSPMFVAINRQTGMIEAVNESSISSPNYHGANATPSLGVVDGRTLVFYADGRGTCYAFDPKPEPGKNGKPGTIKTVWTYNCLKNDDGTSLGRFEVIATPVFHEGRVFVSLGTDPGMSSKEKGRLVCIDARGAGDITRSGTVWRFDDIKASASTVAIHGNRLYCADMLGNVYCLDATTGKLLWQHTVKGGVIWSSPLVADGKVYLGVRGKGLMIFADAPEKRIIHEGGKYVLHTSPAVANGVLYIAAHHAVFALKPTAGTP